MAILTIALPMTSMSQSSKPIDGGDADRFGLLPTIESTSGSADGMMHSMNTTERGGGTVVWSEDFNGAANVGDSIMAANGSWGTSDANGDIWKFTMTQSNGCWSFNTPMPDVTTANNGFLIFDADSVNCIDPDATPDPLFNQDIFTGSVISPIIDLSLSPDVILSFEYQNRHCCTAAGLTLTVDVSGDGGATWPGSFSVETTDANIDLYEVFEANVSGVMGGAAAARFRLTWSGQSHYYWVVDDVAFTVPPADDMRMNFAYVSHNGTSEEYGRIPMDQLLNDITVGAEVFNFGATAQTNVTLDVDFSNTGGSVFTGSDSEATVNPLDTTILEDIPSLPALTADLYEGEFIVTSDNDTVDGSTFDNNTVTRNFEVTESLYSIDGIGVHDVAQLSSLGTNSFTDAEDGFMMLNYYDISSTTWAVGLEILLDDGTEEDGAVVVTVHDTDNVFLDDVTLFLEESEIYDITASDVTAGVIQVMFIEPIELEPNAYFFGVEMFSNAGENTVSIVDDVTVPQPFYSSMIFIPNDQVYSNGNAAAIRLMTANDIGIANEAELNGVSIYPNPTEGLVRIDLDVPNDYSIEVTNVLGELVHTFSTATSSTMDLNRFGPGIYIVKVSNDLGSFSDRVIVQ